MSHKFYLGGGNVATWPDLPSQTFAPVMGLNYRNLLLLQQVSDISSRSEVDISTKLGPYKLKVPIMSAAMDSIISELMIRKLAELGALGTLPRAHTNEELTHNLSICSQLSKDHIPCVYSVGLATSMDESEQYISRGAEVILIDVAQGGMKIIVENAKKIKKKHPKVWIIAGSIANNLTAKMYMDAGVDIIKLGVGNGSACDTRQQAGTGTPQMSAILDASLIKGLSIIADGGVKYPGDVALALAAGASIIMSGSILAGTTETPGKVVDSMKIYRGQASAEYMKDHSISKAHRSIEGVSMKVPYKGDVKNVIDAFSAGLRSAFSYSGAKDLREFQKRAIFQYIGENTYQRESLPQTNSKGVLASHA
jgi:IMP dehydrogenase